MLILISPAKKLLSLSSIFLGASSQPHFSSHTKKLVEVMKSKSATDIARLMHLSSDLAHLNYDRYQHFFLNEVPANATYPALFLFQGDVYKGMQANSWSQEDINYSQQHLAILSGLYGLLKPMDNIQPYRLEMGVRLENPQGATLYHFWNELITEYINELLSLHQSPFLLNLASTEYFKVVDQKKLKHPVVTINFYEKKNNEVKMIGVYAKKARGVMTKYLIQNRIDTIEKIKNFNELGYYFNSKTSSMYHLDFIRDTSTHKIN
jgi:uncharacterized protein